MLLLCRVGAEPSFRLRTAIMDREQIVHRVGQVAAKTFGCASDAIREQTVADDVPGWDSLSHTIFIMGIEEEFGLEFDVSTVFSFNCVADLVTALEDRAA